MSANDPKRTMKPQQKNSIERYSAPRQKPTRSAFAALAASASTGSGGSFGFAQPCRTIQVERSVPETAHRAVNDFCSPALGRSQTTARARTSRLSARRYSHPSLQRREPIGFGLFPRGGRSEVAGPGTGWVCSGNLAACGLSRSGLGA
jgi:hypothetical protein